MSSLLKKLDNYLSTIIQLEEMFNGKPEKLVYSHEFMYQHDLLTHTLKKCNDILKVRIPLRKDMEEHMIQ